MERKQSRFPSWVGWTQRKSSVDEEWEEPSRLTLPETVRGPHRLHTGSRGWKLQQDIKQDANGHVAIGVLRAR